MNIIKLVMADKDEDFLNKVSKSILDKKLGYDVAIFTEKTDLLEYLEDEDINLLIIDEGFLVADIKESFKADVKIIMTDKKVFDMEGFYKIKKFQKSSSFIESINDIYLEGIKEESDIPFISNDFEIDDDFEVREFKIDDDSDDVIIPSESEPIIVPPTPESEPEPIIVPPILETDPEPIVVPPILETDPEPIVVPPMAETEPETDATEVKQDKKIYTEPKYEDINNNISKEELIEKIHEKVAEREHAEKKIQKKAFDKEPLEDEFTKRYETHIEETIGSVSFGLLTPDDRIPDDKFEEKTPEEIDLKTMDEYKEENPDADMPIYESTGGEIKTNKEPDTNKYDNSEYDEVPDLDEILKPDNTEIISFYSPSGGAGATTLSLAFASNIGEDAFYINLERYNSSSIYLKSDKILLFEDIDIILQEDSPNKAKLRALSDKDPQTGIRFFPFSFINENMEAKFLELLELIKDVGEYKYIVIDMDKNIYINEFIFAYSDYTFVITTDDNISAKKTEIYLNNFTNEENNVIINKKNDNNKKDYTLSKNFNSVCEIPTINNVDKLDNLKNLSDKFNLYIDKIKGILLE